MENISSITIFGFILTTLTSIGLIYKANNKKRVIYGITIWMVVVSLLGISGFYRKLNVFPPRFLFLLAPTIIFVFLLFTSKKTKNYINKLNLKWLTLLHVVRIPVEITLYYVFLSGLIPQNMTFDGYNFDIISGITAPIMYYLVFVRKILGRKALLFWNIICLVLLINILTIAVLSAQTPFQKLAFEQPNIGVTYFPFVWLPTIIVPIVLFSHLASIKQLVSKK